VTRDRLQNDFLRLHREVRKTVIFVTHDIDEAIKMGDHICLLRQGGKLAQFGTPEEILAEPADEFVADFVGADRGLKRLSLRRAGDAELEPAPDGAGDLPVIDAQTSLRDALSAMLAAGTDAVAVRDGEGQIQGQLTLTVVSRLLAQDAKERSS
jgi:osmoprotectant transport system ATP-binding protein